MSIPHLKTSNMPERDIKELLDLLNPRRLLKSESIYVPVVAKASEYVDGKWVPMEIYALHEVLFDSEGEFRGMCINPRIRTHSTLGEMQDELDLIAAGPKNPVITGDELVRIVNYSGNPKKNKQ